ncbi:MAG: 7-cyano-7-deazaguanine synthase QueC [Mariprofundales bacterium]
MSEIQQKRAVVLLSGGLDSSTALAWAQQQGWQCHSIAFDYGQRHKIELKASASMAEHLGVVKHHLVHVGLDVIGGSALTSDGIAVPKDESNKIHIPTTYVPARNLIFLSLAAALAESIGAQALVIGANVVDYSGYPDCRDVFLQSFANTACLGSKLGAEGGRLEIIAPLLKLTKAEIIKLGHKLGIDYKYTHSCYDPDPQGRACGHCDSCSFRLQGFKEAGSTDPICYSD